MFILEGTDIAVGWRFGTLYPAHGLHWSPKSISNSCVHSVSTGSMNAWTLAVDLNTLTRPRRAVESCASLETQ